jgi:hypothetical protein
VPVLDSILNNQGTSALRFAEVDLGQSAGTCHQLVNRKADQVIGTGDATVGQKIGQWVDDSKTGSWNLIKTSDGFCRLQSLKNTCLYLTGATAGGQLTLQNAVDDGSQDWELVQ